MQKIDWLMDIMHAVEYEGDAQSQLYAAVNNHGAIFSYQ